MKIHKKYYSIREVSNMLDIKEHVIRHWDSINPKTNKIRIENLSIRSKGGTRFFNHHHISKLKTLKNLLKENGKRNYSLDLALKIISKNKHTKNISFEDRDVVDSNSKNLYTKNSKIRLIKNNLKKLLK